MKWPELARAGVCRTPIRLVIEGEGIDEDGAPEQALVCAGRCFWQDGGEVYLTEEKRTVRIAGRAIMPGDIAPELPEIAAGYGVINGVQRRITGGTKARNPDGSVNYTEVRFL